MKDKQPTDAQYINRFTHNYYKVTRSGVREWGGVTWWPCDLSIDEFDTLIDDGIMEPVYSTNPLVTAGICVVTIIMTLSFIVAFY